MGKYLATSALMALFLSACSLGGIRDSDNTFHPAKVAPCTPIVVDGVEKACLLPDEFARWVKRNMP